MLEIDKLEDEFKELEMYRIRLEEWENKYPSLFQQSDQYRQSKFFKKFEVCHKEINRKLKMSLEIIHFTNKGINYDVGEVTDEETIKFVDNLEQIGLVSQIRWKKKPSLVL